MALEKAILTEVATGRTRFDNPSRRELDALRNLETARLIEFTKHAVGGMYTDDDDPYDGYHEIECKMTEEGRKQYVKSVFESGC